MPKFPYNPFDSSVGFGRKFIQWINNMLKDVGSDLKENKARVDNLIRNTPQPSEVVDIRLDNDDVEHPTARDRLNSDYTKLNTQLGEKEKNLNSRRINVLFPPAPLLPAIVEEGIDTTERLQAIYDYAAINGYKEIFHPSGKYLIDTILHSFTLPYDDGTASPVFKQNGDTDISSEAIRTIPICLKVPNNIRLIGTNGTEFVGKWDILTGDVNLNQKVCLLFTNSNGKRGLNNFLFSRIKISKFMVGFVSEGIIATSGRESFEYPSFEKCGIAGIIQGTDFNAIKNPKIEDCYAGIVTGGWWLHRNRAPINLANIPPYPAGDVYLSGWIDAFEITKPYATFKIPYNHVAESLDEFFNTYFYKDANSKIYPEGRATVNGDSSAQFQPYPGITGRMFTFLNRYGRPIQNVVFKNIKQYGGYRESVYVQGKHQFCYVEGAYLERLGLIDSSQSQNQTGNLFGVDATDPYGRPNNGYAGIYGFDSASLIYRFNSQKGANASQSYLLLENGITVSRDSNTDYEDIIKALHVYKYGTNGRTLYRIFEDGFYAQPNGEFAQRLKVGKGIEHTPIATTDALLNSTFIDQVDGVLKHKDGLGNNRPLFFDNGNVYARSNVSRTVQASVWTKMIYATEIKDSKDEFYDSKFTASKNGTYLISPSVRWDSPASNDRLRMAIYFNGSLFKYLDDDISTNTSVPQGRPVLLDLNAGDFVEIYLFSQNGSVTTSYHSDNMIMISRIN